MIDLRKQADEVLRCAKFLLSNVPPSEWNEMHRYMTSGVSPFPGKFKYDRTPYLKEIVDCCRPGHPAHTIAIMKGAQIGFSTGVIEAAIVWIISQRPSNILFLTGNELLSKEAMDKKIDQAIDSCGIRQLIRPSVLRARNQRTGDTSKGKEFPGGSLVAGNANNHDLLRQRSVQYGFMDDYESVKKSSKEDGDTESLIEQRFAAYGNKKKLFYISTPTLDETSNIKPLFKKGDQRYYYIPCPCCGEYIVLKWEIEIAGTKEKAGITWEVDHRGRLVPGSVGYICQECAGFFDDSKKYELNLMGEWRPTAEPSIAGFYSYHLSSLYAPPGMYDWEHYVQNYIEANPPGQSPIESKLKSFTNLCLGETFVSFNETLKASELQKNQRSYEIATIPEKISIQDGNGKIVLITCACDMNGTEDDARLDWEIVAYAENGANYSIDQGSIGTFIPKENQLVVKKDRKRWTYKPGKENSVWKELDIIISRSIPTDTGRKMKVFITGIDCGFLSKYAYPYIDTTNNNVIGLKGDENKYLRFAKDVRVFKPALERSKLYIIEVGYVKDDIAESMRLKWSEGIDSVQPSGFMNFPFSKDGKYSYTHFFEHYEAEKREIISVDGEPTQARWVKKNTVVQNHFWDVRVYNRVLKDIFYINFCKELKIKNPTWTDYVDIILGRYKHSA